MRSTEIVAQILTRAPLFAFFLGDEEDDDDHVKTRFTFD